MVVVSSKEGGRKLTNDSLCFSCTEACTVTPCMGQLTSVHNHKAPPTSTGKENRSFIFAALQLRVVDAVLVDHNAWVEVPRKIANVPVCTIDHLDSTGDVTGCGREQVHR